MPSRLSLRRASRPACTTRSRSSASSRSSVGASVRLAASARSGDAALLLADGRVLRRAVVHAERTLRPARLLLRLGGSRRAAACCRRCSCTSRSCFPIGPIRGCDRRRRRGLLPLLYVPAAVLGLGRALHRRGRACAAPDVVACCSSASSSRPTSISRSCLLGGLALMIRALDAAAVGHRAPAAAMDRLGLVGRRGAVRDAVRRAARSSAACRRTREYTAVLLGCIPLAFASAIVRYRLMDIEVIIKKAPRRGRRRSCCSARSTAARCGSSGSILGADNESSSFWALFATLIVALVAPWLRGRDPGGARSSLLPRSLRLPARARELRARAEQRSRPRPAEHAARRARAARRWASIALRCSCSRITRGAARRFRPWRRAGFGGRRRRVLEPASALGARLIDRADGGRRRSACRRDGCRATRPRDWRDAGLYSFVPCVSKDATIAVLAVGRRPHGEPLNSEDMTLLARRRRRRRRRRSRTRGCTTSCSGKADEIERLRQFSDSVVESLTRRPGRRRSRRSRAAVEPPDRGAGRASIAAGRSGRRLAALFSRPFVETLRRGAPRVARGHDAVPRAARDRARRRQRAAARQHGGRAVPDRRGRPGRLDHRARGHHRSREPRGAAAAVGEDGRDRAARRGRRARGQHAAHRDLELHADAARTLRPGRSADAQLLEKIEQQTFRAAKIVNSLLNLARPSGGETRRQWTSTRTDRRRALAARAPVQGEPRSRCASTSAGRRWSSAASNTSCSRSS